MEASEQPSTLDLLEMSSSLPICSYLVCLFKMSY